MTSKAWAWLNITSEKEIDMTDTMTNTAVESTLEHSTGRRQLLGTTLAMATGVGLVFLLAEHANADRLAGHVITPAR